MRHNQRGIRGLRGRSEGFIQPGQLADLVVLAQDPFKTDPSELLKIQVERTMVGGNWKYES